MRHALVVLCLLVGSLTSAVAQVSIGIGLPSVSIGINIPTYPTLVRVPGYPVYYAPRLDTNYFFYDGMYWVYFEDSWYSAYWYNGPWVLVAPEVVPLFVLRIPVRYYRAAPPYFRGWRADAPPRWGEHWGNAWAQQRRGWDRWNRQSVPAAAPLPVYQRRYAGDRYPRLEQQRTLYVQNYRHQPRDAVVRQHYREHVAAQKAPASAESKRQAAPQERSPRPQEAQRSSRPAPAQKERAAASRSDSAPGSRSDSAPGSRSESAPGPRSGSAPGSRSDSAPGSRSDSAPGPRSQPPQRGGDDVRRSAPAQAAAQGRAPSKEPARGRGEEKDQGKGEERGQGKK